MDGTDLVDPIEAAINEAVNKAVLKMTPGLMQSWLGELARGITPVAEIATRYGFADAAIMHQVLVANPPLLRRVKAERAVWNSEENLERRLRIQYQLILHEAAHENARPLFDPTTTPTQRVDMIKAIGSVAGVYGMPGGGGRGMEGMTGQGDRWTIQMVFTGANKTEEITIRPNPTPPTIEGESA